MKVDVVRHTCIPSPEEVEAGGSEVDKLHLEGNHLYHLPNEVSSLQHLRAIDLSRNQFRDFPEQLTTLPELETVNLEENEIVDCMERLHKNLSPVSPQLVSEKPLATGTPKAWDP
ncbi:Lrrc20 [Phodopus roborovskii]|uniref:Leucine-rich repeat protein SHOC-2 n=1 Tax=Phodopus roborovskii TaxID=109678 RepID=A0AAU9ZAP3_PHORO|nr:Lrrc20 [Phodopus roborovskii]